MMMDEDGYFGDYNFNQSYYDYNTTPEDQPCNHQKNHSVELVIGPYVHSIICILGFVGNSLVIVTYAFYKRTKSMTDVYLLNVAIADLVFVVLLPLIVYNELTAWSMGPVACKLLRGSYSVNLYSGMLLLACISINHYVTIVQTRCSFRLRSLQYSRHICTIVWVFALLLSVPSFSLYNWYDASTFINEEEILDFEPSHYVCEIKFVRVKSLRVAIPSTQLAVGFFLPLLIMVFCYSAVIITLLKAKNFQQHKAVRVVLVVVAVFVICHLPYNATLLYESITMIETCEDSDALLTAKTVTQTIAYLHCCLNPVLYAFAGLKFRNHFRRIVRDVWCPGHSADGTSERGSSFTMRERQAGSSVAPSDVEENLIV